MALPLLVGSAALVAITLTVCCAAIAAGGEYNPLGEILPTFGFSDQVTAVLVLFVIAAVNCCCVAEFKVTAPGLTVTVTIITGNEKDALEPFALAVTWTVELLVAPVIPSVNVPVFVPAATVTEVGADDVTVLFWPYPRETAVPPEGAAPLRVTVHEAEPGATTVAGEHERFVTVGLDASVAPVAVTGIGWASGDAPIALVSVIAGFGDIEFDPVRFKTARTPSVSGFASDAHTAQL